MSFEFGHRYVNCFSCKHISVITLFSKWNTITIAKTKQNILLRIHNKIYLLLDLSIVEFKLKFFLDETRLDRSRNKILLTYFYPRFFRASYSFCIVLPNFFLEMRESYSPKPRLRVGKEKHTADSNNRFFAYPSFSRKYCEQRNNVRENKGD